MSEDKLRVHAETLWRWMLEEGLWKRARKSQPHHKWRERGAHFGELVQTDGSFHEWYKKRAGKACLMNMVDDATLTVEGCDAVRADVSEASAEKVGLVASEFHSSARHTKNK